MNFPNPFRMQSERIPLFVPSQIFSNHRFPSRNGSPGCGRGKINCCFGSNGYMPGTPLPLSLPREMISEVINTPHTCDRTNPHIV